MRKYYSIGLAITGLTGACSSHPTDGSADEVMLPSVEDDGVGAQQLVTSSNADGTWTADALTPLKQTSNMKARATFTGPTGKTRKMGVCLLVQASPTVSCTNQANVKNEAPLGNPNGTECASVNIPAGGWRYCAQVNGTGDKTCWVRSGPGTTHCAGSPANLDAEGNPLPVAPGTWATALLPSGWGTYISYACFEGCLAGTGPSSSSVAYNNYGSGGGK